MNVPRPTSRSVLALLLVLALALSVVPGLAAAETRTGGTVVVGPDETVRGDLDAFAGSIVVRGTVTGNVNAFGGDVFVAEGARVGGDVSAAAGSVRIAGTVDGSVSGAAGDVSVLESGTVGSLDAGAGSVAIYGTVRGDATVGAETLVVGSTGVVAGDLRYDAGEFVNEGTVEGRVVRDRSIAQGPEFEPVGGVGETILDVYGFLVGLVLGAILLLVLPGFSSRVADRAVSDPLRSGGVGLLALVGVPLALVLFAITIIGIPITVVGALLFAVVAWVGTVYGRFAVGEWLTELADVENRWVALLVGFLAVAVGVRLPLVGGLVEIVVFLLGLGALALVTYEAYRGRSGEGTDPVDPADPDAGESAPSA
ncbi:polymer-forming cytoskeletal protein [Salinirubellus sp. GCM10025818]|uniref:bactofilin family protein n=1 Tax=Salinirubellus TaxID=2162630 RepID=UPI0030CF57FF